MFVCFPFFFLSPRWCFWLNSLCAFILIGADKGLCDSECRWCSLLPCSKRNAGSSQHHQCWCSHSSVGTDHPEERAGYKEPVRDPVWPGGNRPQYAGNTLHIQNKSYTFKGIDHQKIKIRAYSLTELVWARPDSSRHCISSGSAFTVAQPRRWLIQLNCIAGTFLSSHVAHHSLIPSDIL